MVKSGTRHDNIAFPISTAYKHFLITVFLKILLNWSIDKRYMCVKQYTKQLYCCNTYEELIQTWSSRYLKTYLITIRTQNFKWFKISFLSKENWPFDVVWPFLWTNYKTYHLKGNLISISINQIARIYMKVVTDWMTRCRLLLQKFTGHIS